jgi:CheY-like chemotaxis protein
VAHILVVDDEPSVRGALVEQLRLLRHRCTEASNGLEALERLHEREFDLVMTDVMMPELNGFQLLERALPYIEGRIPVVVLSSVDQQGGIEAALEAGAYDWLTKPADPAQVQRVVTAAIRRREENIRLIGRHRGRKGPVPLEALGARAGDRREAPRGQEPAGVPAFRPASAIVSIPRPGSQTGESVAGRRSWWRRLFGRLGGAA